MRDLKIKLDGVGVCVVLGGTILLFIACAESPPDMKTVATGVILLAILGLAIRPVWRWFAEVAAEVEDARLAAQRERQQKEQEDLVRVAAERAELAAQQAREAAHAAKLREDKERADLAHEAEEQAERAAKHEREEKERAERLDAAIQEILTRRSDIVDLFPYVAARHVAHRDEYGMDRKRDLPKLIHECIKRIGELEGFTVRLNSPHDYKNGLIEGLEIIEEVSIDSAVARTMVPSEIAAFSKFSWATGVSEGVYQLSLPDKGLLTVRQNALGGFEIAKHVAGIKTPLGTAATLKDAIRLADRNVPPESLVVLRSDATWRNLGCSEAQARSIKALYPELRRPFKSDAEFFAMATSQYTRGQASMMISQRSGNRR